jgi:S-adenosylmethionine synthetase
MKTIYYNDFSDPAKLPLEIVERKGLGHPDTLADGLAEAVSNEYSKYCLSKFGVVPHHNVDKLYIGAGLFTSGFGSADMVKPVQIMINGRISDRFGDDTIDLIGLQRKAISEYLAKMLPRAKLDENLIIHHNATQNTRRKNWFSPESIDDLPELKKLVANDTSICVAHAPMTDCEKLCIEAERFFWEIDETGQAKKPKFSYIGQDIKIMAIRNENDIKCNACVPIFSDAAKNLSEYQDRSMFIEKELVENILGTGIFEQSDISIKVNEFQMTSPYMLGLGSCVECGEEGLVGRGNGISGTIPTMRPKSNEAYFGKNPVYHVGRVLGFLTQRIANRIYTETGSANSVYTLAINQDTLLPPTNVCVSLADMSKRAAAERIIMKEFSDKDYLTKIITKIITSDFAMKI